MNKHSNRTRLAFLLAGLATVIVLMAPLESLAATGGPDAFGYTWADQVELTVDYNFIDIRTTGTQIVTGDDVISALINLTSPFVFYGISYNQLGMGTNGFLTDDVTGFGGLFDLSNDCPLPAIPEGGIARLAPLHDDLISTGYVQYFPTCPRPSDRNPGEDCTIFMWDSVNHWPNSDVWDMEAILYHQSGDIVFQVGAGNPELGSDSTTGIQNEDATIGLEYACNEPDSVLDNTAVSFYNPLYAPAPPASIPTLSEWGIIMMSLLIGITALITLRRRTVS